RREHVVRLGADLTTSDVTFSPDGRTLAVAANTAFGGDRSTVILLDMDTRRVRARTVLPVSVNALAYVRGGSALATLSGTGPTGTSSVTLWDAKTFRKIGETMEAGRGVGLDLAPTGAGNRVAVGRDVGGPVIWDVDPDLWERKACLIAGRTLTRDEWKQ